jgi:monoamine oxidase
LASRSVLIAGAGLAGLTAAYELKKLGASVKVIEARRDRIGGRVWTRRDFQHGQHAEAGGDLIEGTHTELLRLAEELKCETVRVLRSGFSYYTSASGKIENGSKAWSRLGAAVQEYVRSYTLAEQRWSSGVARYLARRSVEDWLTTLQDESLLPLAVSLRGFFLADPADLSLLALVDQFASDDPASARMFRFKDGNDSLVHTLAKQIDNDIVLGTTVVAVNQGATRVQVRLRERDGALEEMTADFVVLAIPATTLKAIAMDPPLPDLQRQAITQLSYGHATKVLVQFDRRFWRTPARARAFGTDLPIGATWEANEEQSGRPGILAFLAGGRASGQMQAILSREGAHGVVPHLSWLGAERTMVIAAQAVTWENDPWAQGGYAVFKRGYDPELREWLGRPHGHTFFAGEHTSFGSQGYMNGAIESGLRVAREVALAAELSAVD